MRKFIFILAFIVSILSASAQNVEDFTGSLLWKVSGNGLEQPSYILGTYHLFDKDYIDKINGLREAMTSTEQVVGELDMKDMQALNMSVMQHSILSDDETYEKILTKEDCYRLDTAMKNFLGAGMEQFGKLQPSVLSSSIAMVMHTMVEPTFNPVSFVGMDQFLQLDATENGKSVLGLETAEVQINALFYSEPLETQMLSLLCSLENVEYLTNSFKSLYENYKKGNLYQIYLDSYSDENDPCKEFVTDKSKDALLKDRNDKWVEQLPAIMSDKPSLVVVGALHLVGEEGLLYQLNKLNYKVEAVK